MRFLCCSILLLAFSAFADPPAGYYDSVLGKSGAELRLVLHNIIDDHMVVPYNSSSSVVDAADALKVTDEDPTNAVNVILIYSRRSETEDGFSAIWNREHVWPNSLGIDSDPPAYSDLHSLRPADSNVNSSRGNKYFDDSSEADGLFTDPAHIEAPLATRDRNSWEPPDEVKGDLARSLFYMDVRYEGDNINEADLILTDIQESISSSASFMGRLSTLLRWHLEDPVDDVERMRNDVIFNLYQGNRNPFVDHPEWVGAVFQDILEYSVSGQTITVSWPEIYVDAQLQFATRLPGAWTSVAGTPVLNNGKWELPVDASIGASFFRLFMP